MLAVVVQKVVTDLTYLSRGVSCASLPDVTGHALPPRGSKVCCGEYFARVPFQRIVEAIQNGQKLQAYRYLNFYRKHRSLALPHINDHLAEALIERIKNQTKIAESACKRLLPRPLYEADRTESVSRTNILNNFGLLHVHSFNDLARVWQKIKSHKAEDITEQYLKSFKAVLWRNQHGVNSVIPDRYQGQFNPTELSCRGYLARGIFCYAMRASLKSALATDFLDDYNLNKKARLVRHLTLKFILNDKVSPEQFAFIIAELVERKNSKATAPGNTAENSNNTTNSSAHTNLSGTNESLSDIDRAHTLIEANQKDSNSSNTEATKPSRSTRFNPNDIERPSSEVTLPKSYRPARLNNKREKLLERLGNPTITRNQQSDSNNLEIVFPIGLGTKEAETNPFKNALIQIPEVDQLMIESGVQRLENFTPGVLPKGCKFLEQGVFQMRLSGAAGDYRVYFTVLEDQINILDLHIKCDSRATQSKAIKRAGALAASLKEESVRSKKAKRDL